jgi:ankyrin repeat protein
MSKLTIGLTEAIRKGDAALVNELIDADQALLRAPDNPTPILTAIYHGKNDIARLLVDRGAPVSFAEACALGDLERVEQQLATDPEALHVLSSDGYPPLGLAIFFHHPDVARLLIERGADVNTPAANAQRVAPVHAAAAACDHATMRLLLDGGADPNAHQQLDYTPMHGAASRGDVEMAKLLLEHGADRHPKATDGQTPADVARGHGHVEFADWIEGVR